MAPRRSRTAPALALHRTDAAPAITPPPSSRGRLWYDHQVPDEFFAGLSGITNKVRWVREHLPRGKRIKIGGASAWYEADILAFIEAQREEQRILEQARQRASGE